MLTVGPRTKLLRICDHHTSMYLQRRAPTPTVQSCGNCTPESKWRTPNPLYLRPLKRRFEYNLRRDAQRPMQIPTSVDGCAQNESGIGIAFMRDFIQFKPMGCSERCCGPYLPFGTGEKTLLGCLGIVGALAPAALWQLGIIFTKGC